MPLGDWLEDSVFENVWPDDRPEPRPHEEVGVFSPLDDVRLDAAFWPTSERPSEDVLVCNAAAAL